LGIDEKKKNIISLRKSLSFFFQRRLNLTGRTTTPHCHLLLFCPSSRYSATGRRRRSEKFFNLLLSTYSNRKNSNKPIFATFVLPNILVLKK
jgi:hypothetical protein